MDIDCKNEALFLSGAVNWLEREEWGENDHGELLV